MTDLGKRTYKSDLRDDQARRTRWQIVAAAGELFAAHGFSATTVDAIATRAGVSRKTVFTSVGGKVALLKLAYDYAMAGDDEPVPMRDRPAIQRLNAQSDPYRALEMYAGFVTDAGGRVSRLWMALKGAAEVDPEARELYERWQSERWRAQRDQPVPWFIQQKVLRRGLRPDEAADLLWTYDDPALYYSLVVERGWPVARFRRWLASTLREQLLKPRSD